MAKKMFSHKAIISLVLVCTFFLNPLYGQENNNSVNFFQILGFGVLVVLPLVYGIRAIVRQATPITIEETFTCNYWSDTNEDGRVVKNECIGIKNSFNVDDDQSITFVCSYRNTKYAESKLKIYMTSGELYDENTYTLRDAKALYACEKYTIKKMYNKGGAGKWTAKWFLNNECKSIDYFYINAPVTPNYTEVQNPVYRKPKILSYQNINKVCLYASTDELYNKLMEELVDFGPWRVVTRTELDRVLDEQNLQFGSRFDQATAVRIGRLLGADAIIVAERSGDYKGILRILDVETGTYLEFKNIESSRYRSNNDEWLSRSMIPYLLEYKVTANDRNGDIYSLCWRKSDKK